MSPLYTKNGVPLTVRGDAVFNSRGENFGYVRGDAYTGSAAATGERSSVTDGLPLPHSARVTSPRARRAESPSARAARAGTSAWGLCRDLLTHRLREGRGARGGHVGWG